ncbi:MAG TPA: tRNA (adenosine(37)-N6)-dimethylallyltransferase MiaA [Bacteroidales bacterium]|nr:tRNA (adenosine(37)-N6)-dimethylallyltransferase MiaA [Bacteroidales bacterium]
MKTLVVLTGPTGIGKTSLSLDLAEWLGCPIISCDSRQFYREMCIGTAAPSSTELNRVPHYFVGHLSIHDYYSAARFESEVLQLLETTLFPLHDTVLMAGGSMLYIDAVCKGIDDMPDVDPLLRQQLQDRWHNDGLQPLLAELERLDPTYASTVDRNNPKRVLHGLELCLLTGKPYSSFRRQTPKERPFNIIKLCLDIDRKVLYQRIDKRVEQMMAQGLLEEARGLLPHRGLNALNTVGYKELFTYFDGLCSLDEAVKHIQFNTHKYARKQLTWFRRDPDYHWFSPDDLPGIKAILEDS